MTSKKILLLNQYSPYGKSSALESLEIALIACTYEQKVSALFINDGVYQLMKNQDGTAILFKNFSNVYKALGDYGIQHIYLDEASLKERQLNTNELMTIDNDNNQSIIQVIGRKRITTLLQEQDIIITC